MANCPKCLNPLNWRGRCKSCEEYEKWFKKEFGHSYADEIRKLKKDAGELSHLLDDVDPKKCD